ncbi:hypothetical protein [Desulfovibrio sp. JC010]|uniref:hypothetical protein n=1 Tax=Desulfovibrio sp. JC010 TaxID=2593641 RepID=UPI0013D4A953|nr:hypothetical protein [Desulfovibrio sp. JC010]NDV28200.1 hypothetical protein [Desulfovibrio sp. JC010]
MVMGLAYNYGSQMVTSALGNMAMGAVSQGGSGQGASLGNVGNLVGSISSLTGSSGSLMSGMMGNSGVGSSLLSSGGTGSSAGTASGSSGGTGTSLLSSGGGMNYLGMMTQFGQSVLGGSQERSEVEYNSQMAELNNYHLMQQGIYNRQVSYKEARLIKQDAEIKLAALRRELYRRNHSVSGYKGVRLDSGSIVDVREDTIKQAAYDAEIVKYQAEVNSNRHIERGDMSVWSAHSQTVMNYNKTQEATNAGNSAINSSLLSQGTELAGSMLSSKMGG